MGYTLTDGQPVEIMRSGYSRYLTVDLDDDGRQEVILAQAESGTGAHLRIEYYDGREGRMEMTSVAPPVRGGLQIFRIGPAASWRTMPGLFVTSYFGKDRLITDVFCLKDNQELKNLTMAPRQPEERDRLPLLRRGPA